MGASLLAAAEFSWTGLESWFAILKVVLGLGAVIFVHELGHFAVAKLCGVKCEKFYLGFDAFSIKIGGVVLIPASLVKYKWGETEYGIGILPLGGYVKMLGQDDNPARAAEERERSMLKNANGETESSTASTNTDESNLDADKFRLDPRSYQAKSVPQRMAIISAGVIMNLIFAVIFAAIAYSQGVSYEPTVIGTVTPGGPAWEKNIRPGDTVVQIGENLRREHMRFREDLIPAIAFNGTRRPFKMVVVPFEQTEERTVEMVPRTDLLQIKGKLGMVGVGSIALPKLTDNNFLLPGAPAEKASEGDKKFKANDLIVKLDDQSISNVCEMYEYLAANFDRPVTFVVQHEPGEKGETPTQDSIVVEPNPMQSFGLEMEFEPIYKIQEGSPAVAAGLQLGDKLVKLNGQPIGNPLTLSQRLRIFARTGQSVKLGILRDEQEKEIRVSPRLPYTINQVHDNQPIAVDELGVAFYVNSFVSSVVAGSPADLAGIQAGDQLTSFMFKNPNKEQREREFVKMDSELEFSESPHIWPWVESRAQSFATETTLELNYVRHGEEKKASLRPASLPGFYSDARGFLLTQRQEIHKSTSLGESIQLGLRQTWEDATKVYTFLYKLINGDVDPRNLGGPGSIAYGATSEAMQGTSSLLMFLTMLSANLAIVNFLPIPVLDGGHMLFLMYEGIFRRPVGEKLQIILSFAGLIFLLGLMLFVISLDVWRFSPI
jgi:regulator of sigma E protease